MSFIHFDNPPDIPAHWAGDFQVYLSRITIRASDMIEVLTRAIRRHANAGGTDGRRGHLEDLATVSALSQKIEAASLKGADLSLDCHELLRSYCPAIMFKRRFALIMCFECGREYKPRQCSVFLWVSAGESRGRRVVCPEGHTLYSFPEVATD